MARRNRLTDSQRRAMFARLAHPSYNLRREEISRAYNEVKKAPFKARVEVLVQKHPRVAKAILATELAVAAGAAAASPMLFAAVPALGTFATTVAGAGVGITGLGLAKQKVIQKLRQKSIDVHLRQGFTRKEAELLADADLVRRIKGRGVAGL